MRKVGIVLVFILLLVGFVCGQWPPAYKPAAQVQGEVVYALRSALFTPDNAIYAKYGYSEETLLFYNIVALKEISINYELRIKALEKQVVELTPKPLDPNVPTLESRIEKLEETAIAKDLPNCFLCRDELFAENPNSWWVKEGMTNPSATRSPCPKHDPNGVAK